MTTIRDRIGFLQHSAQTNLARKPFQDGTAVVGKLPSDAFDKIVPRFSVFQNRIAVDINQICKVDVVSSQVFSILETLLFAVLPDSDVDGSPFEFLGVWLWRDQNKLAHVFLFHEILLCLHNI